MSPAMKERLARSGLRGSSDVICRIRATARGLHPQANRRSSTDHRKTRFGIENKTESDSRSASPRGGFPRCESPARIRAARVFSGAQASPGGSCCLAAREPCGEPMAGALRRENASGILRMPLMSGGSSQGGVKVPTGGKGRECIPSPRAPCSPRRGRVSRFGAIPKPTVKVRMKESGCRRSHCVRPAVRMP